MAAHDQTVSLKGDGLKDATRRQHDHLPWRRNVILDRTITANTGSACTMLLKKDFQSTVSAIVYSILRERFLPGDPDRRIPHNRAVRFLLEQHGRMADYLRWPLVVLTLAFDWSSLPRHGRRFRRLEPAARARRIEAWRNSPLGLCRDFVRFYDSMVVFYWYSKVDRAVHRDTWSGSRRRESFHEASSMDIGPGPGFRKFPGSRVIVRPALGRSAPGSR